MPIYANYILHSKRHSYHVFQQCEKSDSYLHDGIDQSSDILYTSLLLVHWTLQARKAKFTKSADLIIERIYELKYAV